MYRCNKYTLVVFALALLNAAVSSSLEVSINQDYYEQDAFNPCKLNVGNSNASGYCICAPDDDPADFSTVATLNCGFMKNPSEKEWAALGRARRVFDIELWNRPNLALTEMPPQFVFTSITTLNYFTVKSTGVHTISSWVFGNSTSLSEIDLHDNNIKTLSSYAFANLLNLTVIKLNDNNLTEINRHVFVNLPRLRELLLMKNGIITVHDNALQDLKNLKDLSLRDNRVSVITREVFYGLQNLANLDLHGNAIEFIGDHVFAEMPRLQDLDLSENMINAISPMAFEGLAKLRRLNLRDNKIVRLLPATFSHLSQMFFLDLRNNELETLPEALVKPIYKNLKNPNMQLHLKGNRFECDCHILWMKDLYNDTNSSYVQEHIKTVTCNMFENRGKQDAAVVPPSSTIIHSDNTASDVKVFTEETTTYSFDSERQILTLTAKDLNCHESAAEMDFGRDKTPHKKHDANDGHRHTSQHTSSDRPYSTFHHQHQQTVHKQPDYEQSDGHKLLTPTVLDSNHHHHHHDTTGGGMSSEDSSGSSGGRRQFSSLNEPQATAALEGADVGAPKRTSTVDQKVDTSRISSNYPENSAQGAGGQIRSCDSHLLISIFLSICIALIAK